MRTARSAIRKQLGQEAHIEEDTSDEEEFFSKIAKVNKMSEEEKKKL